MSASTQHTHTYEPNVKDYNVCVCEFVIYTNNILDKRSKRTKSTPKYLDYDGEKVYLKIEMEDIVFTSFLL